MASALDGITPSAFEFVRRRITSARVGICLRRGRADRAFPPSGLAKIFGDDAGVPSRHWLTGLDRFYQRAIRSEEFVPIVAFGVVEQFAQRLCRRGLRLVYARNASLESWARALPEKKEPEALRARIGFKNRTGRTRPRWLQSKAQIFPGG
jgi:hypothetical protein